MSGRCEVIVTPPTDPTPALRHEFAERGFRQVCGVWFAVLDDADVAPATQAFDEACGGDTGPKVMVLPLPLERAR